jgi:hypothetical protein
VPSRVPSALKRTTAKSTSVPRLLEYPAATSFPSGWRTIAVATSVVAPIGVVAVPPEPKVVSRVLSAL